MMRAFTLRISDSWQATASARDGQVSQCWPSIEVFPGAFVRAGLSSTRREVVLNEA